MLERRISEYRQTSGLIAATLINAAPFRGEGAKVKTPLDFFPDNREEKRQTEDEAIGVLESAFGVGPNLGNTPRNNSQVIQRLKT